MTFVNMQTEVGDLLNITVSANTIPDLTQVKRDLNTAKDLAFNRLLSLGQDYNVRLAKADLVADQELYGLPSDIRKLVRVEVGYSNSTDRYKADRIDSNAPNDPVDTTYLASDPKYMLRGNNIELKPTPDSAVTDGLWLWYIEDLTDMSADADTSELPIGYDHLLPLYAAAKGCYTVGKHQEGNNFMSQFKMGLADMEQEIIQRNIDDNDMIIIRDEYGGL
jgi:hypothetical protein